MNKNTAIKVQNLTKTYKLYDKPIDRLKESLHPLKKKYHKDFYALNDVSFEIKKGETVGIVGKNGSGKSTLLKIITGVLTPTSGRANVHGKISAILELGAGFNPEMTGLENIYLNTSINGMNKQETDKKIDEIVAFAELGEFIHQPIKTYSSGMQARLAFAVSINVEPDILIVDEALAVGDMNFQAKCMTAMERIRSRGTTILFVSHSIDSIKSLCQRAVYLKHGRMIAYGEAKDISELYLKEMREEQNIHNKPQQSKLIQKTAKKIDSHFKWSDTFEKRVAQFRYGSGGIRIVNVELLDINNSELKRVEFNQEVKIKIYVESDISKENISINFQLFDAKRIMLTVGNFRVLNREYLNIESNSRYIVEYIMKLPLQQGNYSFQTTISSPIIEDETAEFIDVIPDSIVFQMARRPESRIWGKMHLFPSLKIEKL